MLSTRVWLEYLLDILDERLLQDFYIIPVPNPDGYVYTWEQDRFWSVLLARLSSCKTDGGPRYKNRQNVGPDEECTGIDMNRCVSCSVFPLPAAQLTTLQELGTCCFPQGWRAVNTNTWLYRATNGRPSPIYLPSPTLQTTSRRPDLAREMMLTRARHGTLAIAPLKPRK